MPRRIDTGSRADAIVDAVSHLITTRGLAPPSLRSIAAVVGVSVSTLSNHLTDRTRLLRVSAGRFANEYLNDLGRRTQLTGVHAFVPSDRAEVADMRVLLAWIELGRTDDSLGPVIDHYRSDERLLLGVTLTRLMPPDRQRYLDESELDAAWALVEGLCSAVCLRDGEAIPLERAHSALDFYVAQWLESAAGSARQAQVR